MPCSNFSPPARFSDLPPKQAHFCLGIERFLSDELDISKGGSHVVALSGGADSTALLLILHSLSLKNGGRLIAAHVDHGLRVESADEARHCQSLCERLGVEFRLLREDVAAFAEADKIGLEDAGRKVRYAFFEQLRDEAGADSIMLGHHLGDLCEDVLLRLVRGTGWPALSGMEARDDARHIVRPLLLTTKARLVEFLMALGVSWVEDASNADVSMTRNRIRHSILPLFLEENPNFPEAVIRLWKVGRHDARYWNSATLCENPQQLDASVLNAAQPALRLRLYKRCLDSLGAGQVLADTLFSLDDAWCAGRNGREFQFPGNKVAKITRKGVVFFVKH